MIRHHQTEFKKVETTQDRIASRITSFAGSLHFVYLHIIIFTIWIIYNLWANDSGFDPFPFGLLTLIVSLEAIFLSTFVMLAQNRESKEADLRAELDYEVNVRAEKEVNEIKSILKQMISVGGQETKKKS